MYPPCRGRESTALPALDDLIEPTIAQAPLQHTVQLLPAAPRPGSHRLCNGNVPFSTSSVPTRSPSRLFVDRDRPCRDPCHLCTGLGLLDQALDVNHPELAILYDFPMCACWPTISCRWPNGDLPLPYDVSYLFTVAGLYGIPIP